MTMKLYIWQNTLCDSAHDVIFVMAETVEQARQLVLEAGHTPEHASDLHSLTVAMVNEPEVVLGPLTGVVCRLGTGWWIVTKPDANGVPN